MITIVIAAASIPKARLFHKGRNLDFGYVIDIESWPWTPR